MEIILTKEELEKLREEIKEINEKSKILAKKYEKIHCYNLAYLSRWIVFEKGLKLLFNLYNKKKIKILANEWIKYLEGNLEKKPNEIKNFTVNIQKIPSLKFVIEIIGQCNKIKKVIDSKGKYRKKRNKIAHSLENFSSEKIYLDYKKSVDTAIEQLLTKLTKKINSFE